MPMKIASRALTRFIRDERGSMTVEFMLWLPWLLFWLVFSLGAFFAMETRSDSAKAAYTIADIMSRDGDGLLERSDMIEVQVLFNELLPNAASGKSLRVSMIMAASGAFEVVWTECFGSYVVMTDDAIPVEILPEMDDLDVVLLTETSAPYFAITRVFGLDTYNFTTRVVNIPRHHPSLNYVDDNPEECAG